MSAWLTSAPAIKPSSTGLPSASNPQRAPQRRSKMVESRPTGLLNQLFLGEDLVEVDLEGAFDLRPDEDLPESGDGF